VTVSADGWHGQASIEHASPTDLRLLRRGSTPGRPVNLSVAPSSHGPVGVWDIRGFCHAPCSERPRGFRLHPPLAGDTLVSRPDSASHAIVESPESRPRGA
jgi:hypothetical protein